MSCGEAFHPLDVAGHEHAERGAEDGHEQLDADDLDHEQRGRPHPDERGQGRAGCESSDSRHARAKVNAGRHRRRRAAERDGGLASATPMARVLRDLRPY